MKTWNMNSTNMVFVFAKQFFTIMIFVADMAILMSNFDNFDNDQIFKKTCSEIVLCLLFLLKKIFYPKQS